MTPKEQLANAGLTTRQTECLALFCFDGLTQIEIGERLGIGGRAVRYHLAAARKKLAAAGLEAVRLETQDRPTITSMDPARLDRLGPADIRAKW